MNWLFGRRSQVPSERLPHARPLLPDDLAFQCSTCGRTDLPPAGDWDPPICQECDAAINDDALMAELDGADLD